MFIPISQLQDVFSQWFNVVWILAVALALVETVMFHVAITRLVSAPGVGGETPGKLETEVRGSYFADMVRLFRQSWFDYIVLLVWFTIVSIGCYPSAKARSPYSVSYPELIFAAIQSLAVSHLVFGYLFKRSVTLSYLAQRLVSVLFACGLLGLSVIESYVFHVKPENVTWFFIGFASYMLVLVKVGHSTSYSPRCGDQFLRVDAFKDGILTFVILCLAMNLFPVVAQAKDLRLFAVGLAAIVIAVFAVGLDYIMPDLARTRASIRQIAETKGWGPEFDEKLVKYIRLHVLIRDVVLLLVGVVLVYNVAVFKQCFGSAP
jgi:hypothetical protein